VPMSGSPEKRRDCMVNRLRLPHFEADATAGQYRVIRATTLVRFSANRKSTRFF
jgi:hypothetical protein